VLCFLDRCYACHCIFVCLIVVFLCVFLVFLVFLVFPMFLVVVFSFLSAYLHVCVLWAMLPELNKMNEVNE